MQLDALNSLRYRAGLVLAAAGVVASFFAQDAGGLGATGWIAVGAFVVTALCTVPLIVTRSWDFSFSARKILRDYQDAEPAEALTELAQHRAADFEKTEERLQRLSRWLALAGLVFAIEVIMWILELI